MIQKPPHLKLPVALRRVSIEMKGYRAKCAVGMFDIRDDGALASDTLLRAAHLVFPVRQRQGMDAVHRKARKQCIAVQRFFVFSGDSLLYTRAFRESDVTGRKGKIHARGFAEVARHEPVSGSGHSPVKLR